VKRENGKSMLVKTYSGLNKILFYDKNMKLVTKHNFLNNR
jgi:hypothetical protein